MCGISGFFDRTSQLNQSQLEKYNQILAHRGPDGKGFFIKEVANGSIGLAHVRLSILDLSSLGNQPMRFEDLVIILNGEIYNFKTIQKELEDLGYSFTSSSDTEVVLKSFHAWGMDCVNKFTGMFAFAIYKSTAEKLYLCRDRVGVKPLYWYQDSNQFIFGSELKVFFNTSTFSAKVDPISLATFINFGYNTNNRTMLQGVNQAEAGSWTIYDCKSQKIEVKAYWRYGDLFEKDKFKGSFEEAVSETERLVQQACELRMVSDVPVGIFLSGGFDSTLVTALLQKDRIEKLKTFTIGFTDGIDESKDARKIAAHLGTEHTSYDCKQKDAMDLIPEIAYLYDNPIADISCIPTMLVSKLAKKEVKVALSADGGDELFAGYEGFKSTPKVLERVNKIPLKILIGKSATCVSNLFTGHYSHLQKKLTGLGSMLLSKEQDRIYQMHLIQNGLPLELMKDLFIHPFQIDTHHHVSRKLKDPLDDLFILGVEDILLNLLLVKVDRATMRFSLEGREPLLDHHLMEFAASLPYSFKHNGIESKRPLREIVYKYLPKELMDRPKVGFDLPIYKWLKNDLSYLIDHYLDPKLISKDDYFNPSYIANLVQQFRKDELRYVAIIWRVIVFQMWHERWFPKKIIV